MTEQQPDGGDLNTLRELEASAAASLEQCEAAATEARQTLATIREARQAAESHHPPPATARARARRRWGIGALLPLGGLAAWHALRHNPTPLLAAAGAAAGAAGIGLIALQPWDDPGRAIRPPAAIATSTVTRSAAPPTATVTARTTTTPPPTSAPVPEPATPLGSETSPVPTDTRGWAGDPPSRHTTVPRPTPSPPPVDPPGPIPPGEPDVDPGPGPGSRLICVHLPPLLDLCL